MERIAYLLKVYPRFSETFVVTEILAREAAGQDIAIYALRPTSDTRFHPELARVKAPVTWISRPSQSARFWEEISASLSDPALAQRAGEILPQLLELEASDVVQGIQLAKKLKADRITHIHAHFASLAGRMAWVAHQLTGIPYTVTTHAKDIFHQSVNQTWLRRICSDAQNTIAISAYNKAYLEKVLAGSSAHLVLQYNALELERFPYQLPPQPEEGKPLKILALGRHVPKKGFLELLDALALLKEQQLLFQLTLGGSGELTGAIRQKIQDLNLTEEVTLAGPLTQEEVRQLLGQAHVFVAPCLPAADGNVDGLPTVVLEAMACGTPVITTRVTGLPEVIINNKTGLIGQAADRQWLAQALTQLAQGQVDSRALSRAARQLIEERFDSRLQAQALAALESEGK